MYRIAKNPAVKIFAQKRQERLPKSPPRNPLKSTCRYSISFPVKTYYSKFNVGQNFDNSKEVEDFFSYLIFSDELLKIDKKDKLINLITLFKKLSF